MGTGVLQHATSATLVLLACAALAQVRCAANQQQDAVASNCPVQYATEKQVNGAGLAEPLLLGGVWSGCTGNCQPRDDNLSQICLADPDALTIINVCEYWQRPATLEVAERVSNGAISNFSSCDLWQYVKGRTLWLIGDSHTKNMYNALRCFMIDYFNHSDGECAASNNRDLQDLLERTALRGHIYNTPPRCLHLLGGGRVCMVHNPMGSTMVSTDEHELATLQLLHMAFAEPDDIILTSFGRWHSNNCAGVDAGYTDALELVGAYLKKTRSAFPNVFFQTAEHDHTVCTNGTLNDTLSRCPPVSEGGYDLGISAKVHGLAHSIMKDKYGIPVIDSHEASLFLQDGHVMARQTITGKTDCLHYCRPGLPEIDLWYMTQSFAAAGIKQLTHTSSTSPPRHCVKVLPQNFKPYGALATNDSSTVNASTPTPPGHNTTAPTAEGNAALGPSSGTAPALAPAGWSFVTWPPAIDGVATVDSVLGVPEVLLEAGHLNSTNQTAANSNTESASPAGAATQPIASSLDRNTSYPAAPGAGGAGNSGAASGSTAKGTTTPIDKSKSLGTTFETFLTDLIAEWQLSGGRSGVSSSSTSSIKQEDTTSADVANSDSAGVVQEGKNTKGSVSNGGTEVIDRSSDVGKSSSSQSAGGVVKSSTASRAPRNITRRPVEILFIPNTDTDSSTTSLLHDQLSTGLPDSMQSAVPVWGARDGFVTTTPASSTRGGSLATGTTLTTAPGESYAASSKLKSQLSPIFETKFGAPNTGHLAGEHALDYVGGHKSAMSTEGLASAFTGQPVVATEHLDARKEGMTKAPKWDPNDGDDLYQAEDSLAAALEPSKLHILWPNKDLAYAGPLVSQKRPNHSNSNSDKQMAAAIVNKGSSNDPPVDTQGEADTTEVHFAPSVHPVGTAADGAQHMPDMVDSSSLGIWRYRVQTDGENLDGDGSLVSTGGVPWGVKRSETASFVAPDMPVGEDGSYLVDGRI